VFFHRFQAKAAIRAGARQDHADGERPAIGGQGVQQKIERQSRAMTRQGLREVQGPVSDRQIGSGGDDIEVVLFDRHPVRGLPHGH
jgi:hypothetical protein